MIEKPASQTQHMVWIFIECDLACIFDSVREMQDAQAIANQPSTVHARNCCEKQGFLAHYRQIDYREWKQCKTRENNANN